MKGALRLFWESRSTPYFQERMRSACSNNSSVKSAKIPVAVFSAGLFYEGLKHEKEDYVMTTLKKILFPINPVTTTLFVGTLEGENLHLKDRDENRNVNSIANFQNLDKIREWAHALPSLLDLQQRDFPARIASKHKVGT